MAAKKFAISIPEDVMAEIDRAAKTRGVTRSRFIADVLRRAARARGDAEITQRLDAVFAKESTKAEQREAAAALGRAARRAGTEW